MSVLLSENISSKTAQQTFACSKSAIGKLQKSGNIVNKLTTKTTKTPEQQHPRWSSVF